MNPTRREFLTGCAGLPFAARALAALPSPRRRPRSLILVWLDGGMSHLDTFDGKPEAGVEVRGALGSIAAAVDGVFVSEHLPRLAQRLSRVALLRSVTHGEGNHDRGAQLWLTGRRPSPVLVHPSLGAVCAHGEAGGLPAYVAVPNAVAAAGAGFLPATAGPFEVGGDPARADFAVRALAADPRRERARLLRAAVDELDPSPRGPAARDRDRFVAQAARLVDGDARRWFDLGAEASELRERYGRTRLGQSCLLARRLAEGGVRTVLVTDSGWDHHEGIDKALGHGFPPKLTALDGALSTLLDDLRARSLEDDVLVCVASEFGRTPRLNPSGGRDHWPRAQSILLFGAGVRPAIIGRTDARGEEPVERPLSPADVFATIVAALGLDPETVLTTPSARPVRLVADDAVAIAEVLRA